MEQPMLDAFRHHCNPMLEFTVTSKTTRLAIKSRSAHTAGVDESCFRAVLADLQCNKNPIPKQRKNLTHLFRTHVMPSTTVHRSLASKSAGVTS